MAGPATDFPLKRSQFACKTCKGEHNEGAFFFFALADDILLIDKDEYAAECPQCGAPCEELWYMRNVRLAQGRQTGPRSEAGKNKVRANGYKTGSSYLSGAIPKTLPPAKPGKYAECETCQDFDDCKDEVQRAAGTSRFVACHRQGEVFAKYRAAHLSGDPESLRLTAADNQARMQLVANACLKAVFDEGVYVEHLMISDGKVVKMEQDGNSLPVVEKKINPAINESVKILEKMGFSLTDWTLTPKSKEAKAALEGYLAGQAAAKGEQMDEFLDKYQKNMDAFHAALERGSVKAQNDATKLEVEAEEQETTDGV